MLLWLVFIQGPVIGIGCLAWGIYALRRRQSLNPAQQMRWQKLLQAWNVNLAESEMMSTLQDMQRAWSMLMSWGWIGFGIAMTVVGILRIFQLLLTDGFQLQITALLEEPAFVLQLMGILLGYGIGYRYGFWLLRKESLGRVRYADLRQRKLTDYHTLFVQVLPVGILLYMVLLLLVSMPYRGAQISIPVVRGVSVVAPSWIAWVVPGVVILVMLITEGWLWQIATFPRLLVSAHCHPSLSANIDDLLRSLVSSVILSFEYIIVGSLNAVFLTLLRFTQAVPSSLQNMVLVGVWLPTVLFAAGIALCLFRGHLGGKITGWPWQSARQQREGQTIAGKE